MRTIKFRGKDTESGEWLYGDLSQRLGSFPGIIESHITDVGKVAYRELSVERDTVGQFTGLHDSEGEEIYEGDILREADTGRTVSVAYDPPSFVIAGGGYGYRFLNLPHNFTVIGNIHDC